MVERDIPSTDEIKDFLPKPKIGLSDKLVKKRIVTNFYQITLNESLIFYEYSIIYSPEIAETETKLKRDLYEKVESKISEKYGINFFTGNTFFSLLELADPNEFTSSTFDGTEYTLRTILTSNQFPLYHESSEYTSQHKRILEEMMKKILRLNPNIEFYRNLFVKTNEKQEVSSKKFCTLLT